VLGTALSNEEKKQAQRHDSRERETDSKRGTHREVEDQKPQKRNKRRDR
jgi:hypothetical protein